MSFSVMRPHWRRAIYPAAAMAAQSLIAQATDEPLVLEPFSVAGSPLPRSLSEVPLPVTIVDEAELRANTATSIGAALAHEPGISMSHFGAGSARPIIRGLGEQRVQITEGGLDAFDISDTSPDHAVAAETLLAERVEVIRGPAALLYGSGAVGGIVDVDAGEIPDGPSQGPVEGLLHGRLQTGSDGKAAAARVTAPGIGGVFRVQGSATESGDYVLPGDYHEYLEGLGDHDHEEHEEELESGDHLPNSHVRTRLIAGGWRGFLGTGSLGGAVSYYHSIYGTPGHDAHGEHDHEEHGEHEHHEHETEVETVEVELERVRVRLEGELDTPAPGLRNLLLRFAWGDYWHTESHGEVVETRFERNGWEGRIEALHEPVGNITGVLGAQVSQSQMTAEGAEAFTPPSDTRSYAAFALEEWRGEKLTVTGGLRIEQQEIGIDADMGSDYSEAAASGSVGVIRRLNDSWRVGSNLHITSRHPTGIELFSEGPHAATSLFEIGDSTLELETARGGELFLRRVAGNVTGSLNFFYTSFDSFIYLRQTGEQRAGLDVARFVAEDVVLYGGELDLRWEAWRREQWVVALETGGDVTRSEIRSTGASLPRMPPKRAWLGVEFLSAEWTVEARLVHAFRQGHTAQGEEATPGYNDLSLRLERRFADGQLRVYAVASNILDDIQVLHTSFLKERAPLPGRALALGVAWEY